MPRKKADIHYIYKTTNVVTSRYYIGMHSTNNIDDGYMGSGKRLRHSIRKYGVDNHVKEILEYQPTRELLIEAEKKAITPDMLEDKNCMNLKEGGSGGYCSKEHMLKCVKAGGAYHANRMKTDEVYRAKVIETVTESIKKSNSLGKLNNENNKRFTGKKHKLETIELMREAHKGAGLGQNNSQFGTCWITKDGLNKKVKKEEIAEYLSEGWEKGRKIKE